MKTVIYLVLVSIVINLIDGCTEKKTTESIQLIHIGTQAKLNRVLLISTHVPILKLTPEEEHEIKQRSGNELITEELLKAYYITKYDIKVVDQKTYVIAQKFLVDMKEKYTSRPTDENETYMGSFKIIIKDKISYNLAYSKKRDFFIDFLNVLRRNHCDEKLAAEISRLTENN